MTRRFWTVGSLGLAALMLGAAGAVSLRDQIVEAIDAARAAIDVAVYEINSREIAEALIAARQRGVRVRVIVDAGRSMEESSQTRVLEDAGIPVKKIPAMGWEMLHHKFIIFDGKRAATPSYNYSRAALKTDEESRSMIEDRDLIGGFEKEFSALWSTIRNDPAPSASEE